MAKTPGLPSVVITVACWNPASRASLRHVLRARRVVAILGGDRRQRDPVLQALDGLVVTFGDFAFDVGEIVGGWRRWR